MWTKALSSPFKRRRWTEQDARHVHAALQRSGKPVSVFAAGRGLILSAGIRGSAGSAEPRDHVPGADCSLCPADLAR